MYNTCKPISEHLLFFLLFLFEQLKFLSDFTYSQPVFVYK